MGSHAGRIPSSEQFGLGGCVQRCQVVRHEANRMPVLPVMAKRASLRRGSNEDSTSGGAAHRVLTIPATEGGSMRRALLSLLITSTVAAVAAAAAPAVTATASPGTPLWVKHVARYPGGISNTVRSYVLPEVRAQMR